MNEKGNGLVILDGYASVDEVRDDSLFLPLKEEAILSVDRVEAGQAAMTIVLCTR